MKRFDIIKPVENHPEEICCTECWQRGIEWGAAGEREGIFEMLEENLYNDDDCKCDSCKWVREVLALIETRWQKDNETVVLLTEGEGENK